MMISKKNLNGNPIHLNEGFISDKIASVKEITNHFHFYNI